MKYVRGDLLMDMLALLLLNVQVLDTRIYSICKGSIDFSSLTVLQGTCLRITLYSRASLTLAVSQLIFLRTRGAPNRQPEVAILLCAKCGISILKRPNFGSLNATMLQ